MINDPDQIMQGTEITINTITQTITLNLAGNLSEDGVSLQAIYSFWKEDYLDEINDIHKHDFPFQSITDEQFEVGSNGFVFSNWTWANDSTRKLIRTAGWREYDDTGAITREYMCPITLGPIDFTSKTVGDKAYYAFSSDSASTEFTYAGPVNEAIQIYGNATNGNFDKRSDVLKLFIRQQGKKYDQSSSTEIGLTTLTYKAERFPLQEEVDSKITASDSTISTNAPYTGMSITYHQTAQVENIGGSNYNYGVTVDGNNGTAEQINEFVAYSLRQLTDIDTESDAPTQIGNLQDQLMVFEGDTLKTLLVSNADGGGGGVRIINFDPNDTNRIILTDNTGAGITFPFKSAGNIRPNVNAVNDVAAKYWLFFKNAGGNEINSANAIIINDSLGSPITGLVSGNSVIPFDFDYDGNNQGGRTPNTDAEYVLRIQGLNTAKFAETTGFITRATGIDISITSSLERNYLNPA